MTTGAIVEMKKHETHQTTKIKIVTVTGIEIRRQGDAHGPETETETIRIEEEIVTATEIVIEAEIVTATEIETEEKIVTATEIETETETGTENMAEIEMMINTRIARVQRMTTAGIVIVVAMVLPRDVPAVKSTDNEC